MMIKTTKALYKIIAAADDNLYVRWSRGSRIDRRQGTSRDYLSGSPHTGLSAVPIDADWAADDVRMARRVTEYWFLRIKDEQIGCHIYRAERVGTDSDGYALISHIQQVGTLDEALINELRRLKAQ
jgi:hypothetical protein